MVVYRLSSNNVSAFRGHPLLLVLTLSCLQNIVEPRNKQSKTNPRLQATEHSRNAVHTKHNDTHPSLEIVPVECNGMNSFKSASRMRDKDKPINGPSSRDAPRRL